MLGHVRNLFSGRVTPMFARPERFEGMLHAQTWKNFGRCCHTIMCKTKQAPPFIEAVAILIIYSTGRSWPSGALCSHSARQGSVCKVTTLLGSKRRIVSSNASVSA